MSAYERAVEIVRTHAPDGVRVDRQALVDAVQAAILQAEIRSVQPRELSPDQAGSILYQIVFFIDEFTNRLLGAGYPEQANGLRDCRRRVLALYGIQQIEVERGERGNVDHSGAKKPVAREAARQRKATA